MLIWEQLWLAALVFIALPLMKGEEKNAALSLARMTLRRSSLPAHRGPDGGVNINNLRPGGFSGAEYRSARLNFPQSAARGIKPMQRCLH